MNCEELREHIRELCEEYGHSTVITAAAEDLERAIEEKECQYHAVRRDIQQVNCDHPRHRNPGLITDCPECGAKF